MVLQEIDNAIIDISRSQIGTQRLKQAADSAAETVELLSAQYETGLTDFNNVLITQRNLLAQQEQLAVSRAEMVVNLITLYKALGGGRDPDETLHSPGDRVGDEP